MTTSTRARGARWERAAERFLEARGLRLVCRNFHGKVGEIDLVMLDGPTLVFIEVRYRASSGFGSPASTVTPVKQRRVVRAAQRFLQSEQRFAAQPCRFDVVAVVLQEGRPVMKWIRSAFEAA